MASIYGSYLNRRVKRSSSTASLWSTFVNFQLTRGDSDNPVGVTIHSRSYGAGLKDHPVCHPPSPRDSSTVNPITIDLSPTTYTHFPP